MPEITVILNEEPDILQVFSLHAAWVVGHAQSSCAITQYPSP